MLMISITPSTFMTLYPRRETERRDRKHKPLDKYTDADKEQEREKGDWLPSSAHRLKIEARAYRQQQ
jgi:hypothetical protein